MKSEKITNTQKPAAKRHYEDACAVAHGLELVGERWALLVIRELMLGPRRFSDLRVALPGISANVLTQRLEGLEESGILRRRRLPPPAAAQVYELTEWGYQSEPVFQALGRWAARSPSHDPSLPFSAVSFFLSLRTMFDAGRAGDLKAALGFRFGGETFMVRVAKGGLRAERGPIEGADVVLSGSPATLGAAIYGGVPLQALEAGGAVAVDGDRGIAERFVGLFPLPDKVAAQR